MNSTHEHIERVTTLPGPNGGFGPWPLCRTTCTGDLSRLVWRNHARLSPMRAHPAWHRGDFWTNARNPAWT